MDVKIPEISRIPETKNTIKSLILSFLCSFWHKTPDILKSWNVTLTCMHVHLLCMKLGALKGHKTDRVASSKKCSRSAYFCKKKTARNHGLISNFFKTKTDSFWIHKDKIEYYFYWKRHQNRSSCFLKNQLFIYVGFLGQAERKNFGMKIYFIDFKWSKVNMF